MVPGAAPIQMANTQLARASQLINLWSIRLESATGLPGAPLHRGFPQLRRITRRQTALAREQVPQLHRWHFKCVVRGGADQRRANQEYQPIPPEGLGAWIDEPAVLRQ